MISLKRVNVDLLNELLISKRERMKIEERLGRKRAKKELLK